MRINRQLSVQTCCAIALLMCLAACSKSGPAVTSLNAEPESPVVLDCQANADECQQVIDCSTGDGKCRSRSIQFSVSDCSQQEPPNNCRNFAKRLKDVTLVTDTYNFVSAPVTSEKFKVEVIPVNLNQPWDLEFLPNGSMLITERAGNILHVKNGHAKKVHHLDVLMAAESGLMGLAIDPHFAENHFIYVFYSYGLDTSDPAFLKPPHEHKRRILNRISRFTFNNSVLSDETIILDGIPGSTAHTGGGLEFGPDDKLYATTGDAFLFDESQKVAFLGGKILRLNPDGSVPADNPIAGSYVYSLGHRNPQGLAWHPVTSALYASEHGPERFDEINLIEPGKNYGWGSFQCDLVSSKIKPAGEVVFPIVCFAHWTMAPSGMIFVSDPDSPWFGNLFVAGLRGKHLHRYAFRDGSVVTDEIFYISGVMSGDAPTTQRLRDVEYYDGSLYVIGDFRMLVKLTPDTQSASTDTPAN